MGYMGMVLYYKVDDAFQPSLLVIMRRKHVLEMHIRFKTIITNIRESTQYSSLMNESCYDYFMTSYPAVLKNGAFTPFFLSPCYIPGDAYMLHCAGSPSFESVLIYCQLDLMKKISWTCAEIHTFHSRKCIWNCRLRSGRIFSSSNC